MKVLALICLVSASAAVAFAGWEEDLLGGGLIGGALGALVGLDDDVDVEVAAPAGAALGALLGYGYGRGWFRADGYGWYGDRYRCYDDRWWDADPWYRTRPHRHWRRYRRPVHAVKVPARGERARATARRAAPVQAAPVDRHPGVSIVRVPTTLANGVTIRTRILRVGGRFVGPQGETYDKLPSGEELARRYRP